MKKWEDQRTKLRKKEDRWYEDRKREGMGTRALMTWGGGAGGGVRGGVRGRGGIGVRDGGMGEGINLGMKGGGWMTREDLQVKNVWRYVEKEVEEGLIWLWLERGMRGSGAGEKVETRRKWRCGGRELRWGESGDEEKLDMRRKWRWEHGDEEEVHEDEEEVKMRRKWRWVWSRSYEDEERGCWIKTGHKITRKRSKKNAKNINRKEETEKKSIKRRSRRRSIYGSRIGRRSGKRRRRGRRVEREIRIIVVGNRARGDGCLWTLIQ